MTTAVSLAQSVAPGVSLGFKNRIINGGMVIDQRNAGAEVNPAVGGTYYLDRWAYSGTNSSKFKIGQNAGGVTPPVGFTKYLGLTSLSAATLTTGESYYIMQRIEGLNVSDLAWGTANAQPITVSFKVYSSLTGTFGGSIWNGATNRLYPFTYTISSANTWTTASVTIPGDTTGTWVTDTGIGMYLTFCLGASSSISGPAGSWYASGSNPYYFPTGATSVVGTNGATFYITGVQLEVGTAATSFEFRDYGRELIMCQRYYWKPTNYQLGLTQGTNVTYRPTVQMPVTMRSAPTLDSGASYAIASGSAGTPAFLTGTGSTVTVDEAGFWNSNSNWSTGQWVSITCGLNAEL